MICPSCAIEIPGSFKFCPQCGGSVGDGSGSSRVEELGNDRTLGESPTLIVAAHSDGSLGEMHTMVVEGGGTLVSPLQATMRPLEDRYEVLEELGRGGFAVVMKARDKKLGRMVAVKRLLTEKMQDSAGRLTLERFRREARTLASLTHRNIVQVFDNEDDDRGPYMVMELVDGGTLKDYLRSRGKLEPGEAVALVRAIAQGLSAAHRKNLIHRDIKPANVLLTREGEEWVPKIVDFGLARMGTESEISMSGYGMGTPFYMPPEQRRDAKSVNHTADIYALGKTLYELLTGEIPDIPDPSKIPAGLSDIIFKCLKNNPEERYFSADELVTALNAAGQKPAVPLPGAIQGGHACPACGTANANEIKFCEHCGNGLTRNCPECGGESTIFTAFCRHCGTDVPGMTKLQGALDQMRKFALKLKFSRVLKEASGLAELAKDRIAGRKAAALWNEAGQLEKQAARAEEQIPLLEAGILEGTAAHKGSEVGRMLQEYGQYSAEWPEGIAEIAKRQPLLQAAEILEEKVTRTESQLAQGDLHGAMASLGSLPILPDSPSTEDLEWRAQLVERYRENREKMDQLWLDTVQNLLRDGPITQAEAWLAHYEKSLPDLLEEHAGFSARIPALRILEEYRQGLESSRILAEAGKRDEALKELSLITWEMPAVQPEDEPAHSRLRQDVDEFLAQMGRDWVAEIEREQEAVRTSMRAAAHEGKWDEAKEAIARLKKMKYGKKGDLGLLKDFQPKFQENANAISAEFATHALDAACKIRRSSLGLALWGQKATAKATLLRNQAVDLEPHLNALEIGKLRRSMIWHTNIANFMSLFWVLLVCAILGGGFFAYHRFTDLLAQRRLDNLIKEGEAALQAKNGPLAAEKAAQALLLNPGFVEAGRLKREAEKVIEVQAITPLLEKAASLKAKEDWDGLLAAAEEILALLPAHEQGTELLGFAREKTKFAKWTSLKNEAKAASEKKNWKHAISKIDEALVLYLDDDLVRMKKSFEQEIVNARIGTMLAEAEEAKAKGLWPAVESKCLEILSIQEGQTRALALGQEARKQITSGKIRTIVEGIATAKQAGNWPGVQAGADSILSLQPDHAQGLEFRQLALKEIAAEKIRVLLKEAQDAAAKSDWLEAAQKADTILTLSPQESGAAAILAEARKPKPIVDLGNRVKIEMVKISAGQFAMGSPPKDSPLELVPGEERQHTAIISKDFWMAKTEITQEQWQAIIPDNPSMNRGLNLPVENVSWEDCRKFIDKLNDLVPGGGFSLPTEAQWEFACRAGTTGQYAGELDEMGWHLLNSLGAFSKPVATRKPNAWGLYDMHGNKWEWCEDWYGAYPSGKTSDYSGPATGDKKVVRGGSTHGYQTDLRSARRGAEDPGGKFSGVGFRPVRLAVLPEHRTHQTHSQINTPIKTGEKSKIPTPESIPPSPPVAPYQLPVVRSGTENPSIPAKTDSSRKAGEIQTVTAGPVSIALVWVPPGTFEMGSPSGEWNRDKDERQHTVSLTRGFWMGKTEVFQAQWRALMGNNPSNFSGDDLPVENVSWNDCQMFISRINTRVSGGGFSLPTEAQWEYACRAGSTGRFAGDLDRMGWYDKNSDDTTHPIGQMQPNAWGLYDMHGNVREWCQDWYGEYSPDSVTDPVGPGSGMDRVGRGGNWLYYSKGCRSAIRYKLNPDFRGKFLGLRLVRAE